MVVVISDTMTAYLGPTLPPPPTAPHPPSSTSCRSLLAALAGAFVRHSPNCRDNSSSPDTLSWIGGVGEGNCGAIATTIPPVDNVEAIGEIEGAYAYSTGNMLGIS